MLIDVDQIYLYPRTNWKEQLVCFPTTVDKYEPCSVKRLFNFFPNNKFLDRSYLKAIADNTIHVTEKFKFVLEMENIVGKRENAGYQHFLHFPQYF